MRADVCSGSGWVELIRSPHLFSVQQCIRPPCSAAQSQSSRSSRVVGYEKQTSPSNHATGTNHESGERRESVDRQIDTVRAMNSHSRQCEVRAVKCITSDQQPYRPCWCCWPSFINITFASPSLSPYHLSLSLCFSLLIHRG